MKNWLLELEFNLMKHLPKEESVSGSEIHCDKAYAKSGGYVKNQRLEVEFSMTKRLPEMEVK